MMIRRSVFLAVLLLPCALGKDPLRGAPVSDRSRRMPGGKGRGCGDPCSVDGDCESQVCFQGKCGACKVCGESCDDNEECTVPAGLCLTEAVCGDLFCIECGGSCNGNNGCMTGLCDTSGGVPGVCVSGPNFGCNLGCSDTCLFDWQCNSASCVEIDQVSGTSVCGNCLQCGDPCVLDEQCTSESCVEIEGMYECGNCLQCGDPCVLDEQCQPGSFCARGNCLPLPSCPGI